MQRDVVITIGAEEATYSSDIRVIESKDVFLVPLERIFAIVRCLESVSSNLILLSIERDEHFRVSASRRDVARLHRDGVWSAWKSKSTVTARALGMVNDRLTLVRISSGDNRI